VGHFCLLPRVVGGRLAFGAPAWTYLNQRSRITMAPFPGTESG
jgi:hypothetical protein